MKEQPCRIDGVEYESEGTAAKALGIAVRALRWRLISSNFPNYNSKYHPKKTVKQALFACSIAGIEYRSVSAAAKKLNLSSKAIKRRLASLDYPDYVCAYILKKPFKKRRRKNQKPCTVDGIDYETELAAARVLGITVIGLQARLRSSNFPKYTSKYRPKIQRKKARIPCSIKGVEYVSFSSAARKLKTSVSTIFNRLKSPNFPDYVCVDIPKEPLKPPKYRYVVNGRKYATLREIGDMEGLTIERIRQKMNDPSYREYKRFKGKSSRKR